MDAARNPTFHVGDLPVYGDLILSPMDGFSDLPFRLMCRELGSAMSYTEFVNVLDVLNKSPRVQKKLAFDVAERPVVFQIFDSEPQRLVEAALILQELGPDVIDINMGCSDKAVSGRGAGAGLLRNPLKIARIFRKLSTALSIPVTGKIRIGWDEDCRNFRLVARIIEENGGKLIAVHGRTKRQGYGGVADWDAIAEVKQMLRIPVIANGDVRTVADIERIKTHTGSDAVMIGRGAIGNPWIFSRRDREDVPPVEVRAALETHLERCLAFYGETQGLVLFRKHASRYIRSDRFAQDERKNLLTSSSKGEFLSAVEHMMALPATIQ